MIERTEVLVTRRIPDAGIDLLNSELGGCDVGADERNLTREELLDLARGRAGILPMLSERIDAELMDAAGESLRVVANYAVGYDNIDVAEATRRGVVVANTPGVLTETTADLAWALIMSASRRVVEGDALVRSGAWRGWAPMLLLGTDVHGATLGIVGAGRIGSAVARRGAGFGMKVLYADTQPSSALEDGLGARRVGLDELLAGSDVVSVHVPLTEATRGLIGARELSMMKSTAVLVNTSRGAVIDEAALVESLRGRGIFAAGLDVYEREPAVSKGLAELENAVMLPHLGSASQATRSRMAELAAGAPTGIECGGGKNEPRERWSVPGVLICDGAAATAP